MFQWVVGTLGLGIQGMDDYSLLEIFWLLENHYEEERKRYELLCHTISVGIARTKSKKKIKLFEDRPRANAQRRFTREEKDNAIKSLLNKFHVEEGT